MSGCNTKKYPKINKVKPKGTYTKLVQIGSNTVKQIQVGSDVVYSAYTAYLGTTSNNIPKLGGGKTFTVSDVWPTIFSYSKSLYGNTQITDDYGTSLNSTTKTMTVPTVSTTDTTPRSLTIYSNATNGGSGDSIELTYDCKYYAAATKKLVIQAQMSSNWRENISDDYFVNVRIGDNNNNTGSGMIQMVYDIYHMDGPYNPKYFYFTVLDDTITLSELKFNLSHWTNSWGGEIEPDYFHVKITDAGNGNIFELNSNTVVNWSDYYVCPTVSNIQLTPTSYHIIELTPIIEGSSAFKFSYKCDGGVFGSNTDFYNKYTPYASANVMLNDSSIGSFSRTLTNTTFYSTINPKYRWPNSPTVATINGIEFRLKKKSSSYTYATCIKVTSCNNSKFIPFYDKYDTNTYRYWTNSLGLTINQNNPVITFAPANFEYYINVNGSIIGIDLNKVSSIVIYASSQYLCEIRRSGGTGQFDNRGEFNFSFVYNGSGNTWGFTNMMAQLTVGSSTSWLFMSLTLSCTEGYLGNSQYSNGSGGSTSVSTTLNRSDQYTIKAGDTVNISINCGTR